MTSEICVGCLNKRPGFIDTATSTRYPPIELFDGKIFDSGNCCDICNGSSIAPIPSIEVMEDTLTFNDRIFSTIREV